MKKLIFLCLLSLNLLALALAIVWFSVDQTYKPAIVALTSAANFFAVLYTKPHWTASRGDRIVFQKDNLAGGDIAGGDITKHGDSSGGR